MTKHHIVPPTIQENASVCIYIACKIAKRYGTRLPSVHELMAEWGMSRATAYRWIAGMRAAIEEDTENADECSASKGARR